MADLYFKRGSTFSYAGTIELPAGTWTASSNIETTDGGLVQALTVTLTPPVNPATAHSLLLYCTDENTAQWPLGIHRSDVKFTNDLGDSIATPTYNVYVEEGIT